MMSLIGSKENRCFYRRIPSSLCIHTQIYFFISIYMQKQNNNKKYNILTLRPDTVGRSVSGELAVILWAAITPDGDKKK